MKTKNWKIELGKKAVRKEEIAQAVDEWAEMVYKYICQLVKDQNKAPLTASQDEAERDADAA